jgi:hypothetical protein
MPSLSKRIWKLPNGEEWATFRVEWKENGHPRRKPFSSFGDAAAFLAQLKCDLKARGVHARGSRGIDRVVRPSRKRTDTAPPPRRQQ